MILRQPLLPLALFATLSAAAGASAPESYTRLWNDPAIASRIARGIETHRKGDATVEVRDGQGRPVPGATVEARHERHAFLFGCNLFALGQLASPALNAKYERAFAALFNFATLPFYWRELEPEPGKLRFDKDSEPIWRRPPPDALVEWCAARGITPKGHALMYAKTKFMPDWTARTDPEALRVQASKHMSEIAARYGNTIPIWDVINEELPRAAHPTQWHAVPADYLPWCFREADRLLPKSAILLINDGIRQSHDTTDQYIAMVRGLQATGARVGGIGIQFHAYGRAAMLAGTLYPPAHLLDVYDRFARLGLPLYITEVTVPGTGDDGPALQAAVVENLYRAWFSAERMAGVTWWNLGDGTAYQNENLALGGLLDETMEPKPAYRALDRLINREWRTHATVTTGADGRATFRGFHGSYRIEARAPGGTADGRLILQPGAPGRATLTLRATQR